MTLHLIGTGLADEKDISIKGLEIIQKCSNVYLENYTSLMSCNIEELQSFYGKKITVVDRQFVEQGETIVAQAKESEVAMLVIGDPFGATTHIDLMLRCRKAKVKFNVVNNASILTAVGITGLQIYKFGKTTSVPFTEINFRPETSYEVIRQNNILGLHTLLLLDLNPAENKFMTVKQAIEILLEIESRKGQGVINEQKQLVACARIGSTDFTIKYASAQELLSAELGKQPHCLIIPGELHFVEVEALACWK